MDFNLEEAYDRVYRYCYFKLHDASLAEDVTQEAFLRFLEKRDAGHIGKPMAYLYTVARNLCIDEYRKITPEPLQGSSADVLPEALSDAGFEEESIERVAFFCALDALAERERELLLMRYVNEVAMEDLVRFYGKSRFSLYRELQRIVRKLERRMADEVR